MVKILAFYDASSVCYAINKIPKINTSLIGRCKNVFPHNGSVPVYVLDELYFKDSDNINNNK
jgi:hypothetical protein